MNFDLDQDQLDAAAGAKQFFGGQASPAQARAALEDGPVAPGRKALADIGFTGITVAESAGGAGVRCWTSPSSPSRPAPSWPGRRWSPPPAPPCCWPTSRSWPRRWPTGPARSASSTAPPRRWTPSVPTPSWRWWTVPWWWAAATW
ncbi:hypothetical protein ACFQX8_00480 [Klenkia terrae]|uniref:hypothetical protein n=1 Tax=Klenkia terrae TaxID=1052259 RepID=UPI0036160DD7